MVKSSTVYLTSALSASDTSSFKCHNSPMEWVPRLLRLIGPTELKSRCRQSHLPSGGPRGGSTCLPSRDFRGRPNLDSGPPLALLQPLLPPPPLTLTLTCVFLISIPVTTLGPPRPRKALPVSGAFTESHLPTSLVVQGLRARLQEGTQAPSPVQEDPMGWDG